MGKVTISEYTTKQPLNMIGEMAGICWNSDISDNSKNIQRAMDCIESNHGRTMEFPDVYLIIDGYSARVMRELYTHIGGAPTRLQSSTRYVDGKSFEYVIPPKIEDDEDAKEIFVEAMEKIRECYTKLDEMGLPREDVAMMLPLGMKSKMIDRCNLRHLMDMSRQRMCSRAYWEYRKLFNDICEALKEYSSQWGYLVDKLFYPKCEACGYCPEKKSCGRKPKKIQK